MENAIQSACAKLMESEPYIPTVAEHAMGRTVGYGDPPRSELPPWFREIDKAQQYLLEYGGGIATKKLPAELDKILREETF